MSWDSELLASRCKVSEPTILDMANHLPALGKNRAALQACLIKQLRLPRKESNWFGKCKFKVHKIKLGAQRSQSLKFASCFLARTLKARHIHSRDLELEMFVAHVDLPLRNGVSWAQEHGPRHDNQKTQISKIWCSNPRGNCRGWFANVCPRLD
jgi:hypothetical protein